MELDRPDEPCPHFEQIIRNPHCGVGGRPFTVIAVCDDTIIKEGYWTQAEALDRRDQLLDQGWVPVRVLGLPTVIAG